MNVGDKFPEFALPDENGDILDSKDLKGKRYVIYFYPKDNTSGCAREAEEFSASKDEFEKLGIQIIGVSKDSVASHRKFIDVRNLTIKLLSDTELSLIKESGVWGPKMMYGKEVMGLIRSTFIVGKDGKIEATWTKVKVTGHVDSVLEKAKSL